MPDFPGMGAAGATYDPRQYASEQQETVTREAAQSAALRARMGPQLSAVVDSVGLVAAGALDLTRKTFDTLVGNDLNTVCDLRTSLSEKAGAAADLMLNIAGDAKGLEVAGKFLMEKFGPKLAETAVKDLIERSPESAGSIARTLDDKVPGMHDVLERAGLIANRIQTASQAAQAAQQLPADAKRVVNDAIAAASEKDPSKQKAAIELIAKDTGYAIGDAAAIYVEMKAERGRLAPGEPALPSHPAVSAANLGASQIANHAQSSAMQHEMNLAGDLASPQVKALQSRYPGAEIGRPHDSAQQARPGQTQDGIVTYALGDRVEQNAGRGWVAYSESRDLGGLQKAMNELQGEGNTPRRISVGDALHVAKNGDVTLTPANPQLQPITVDRGGHLVADVAQQAQGRVR